MPKFDWFWFLAGILFSMFVMPLLSRLLGTLKSGSATGAKKVA